MLRALIEWFLSSPPAQTITALGAIVVGLRVQSNHEHRKTLTEIRGVGEQLNGGLLKRIARLEKIVGIGQQENGGE